jgi:hypothetical protein
VYRQSQIPNIKETISLWNTVAKKTGFENGLYIMATTSYGYKEDPTLLGFDASMDFSPHYLHMPTNLSGKLFKAIKRFLGLPTYLYRDVMENMVRSYSPALEKWKVYPSVTPGWDNSPRRKTNAYILHSSTPKLYEKWLRNVCEKFEPFSEEENFVILNAMNEWAEGNHLEPDLKWGLEYLEKTKKILEKYT